MVVAPAIGVELCQTEERIGTESECLRLQEVLVALVALGIVDIIDDGIGIAHQLIIIVPRINIIGTCITQVIS